MTLRLYSVAFLILTTTLISCAGSDNNDYIDKSLITSGSQKTDTAAVATNNTIPNSNTPVIPGVSTINPQAQNVQIAPPATATTAPGMNPPHGQPGHRCDIAVGAPLNSKPAPANVQPATVSTQPNPVTIKEVPNTTKTTPGMNPPHGEPGHRCDIAVGAPLNSKPAATTAAPAKITAPPLMLTPAKNDSAKN